MDTGVPASQKYVLKPLQVTEYLMESVLPQRWTEGKTQKIPGNIYIQSQASKHKFSNMLDLLKIFFISLVDRKLMNPMNTTFDQIKLSQVWVPQLKHV